MGKLGTDVSLSNVVSPAPSQKAKGCLLRAEAEKDKCVLSVGTLKCIKL